MRRVPLAWVPLAGLEPATCCLEDVSAPSSEAQRVRFQQVRSGAPSAWYGPVLRGGAWWNDRENDRAALCAHSAGLRARRYPGSGVSS